MDDSSNVLGNLGSVTLVNLHEVSAESIFDILTALAEGSRNVGDAVNTVLFAEGLVEESAGLLVVIIGVLVGVSTDVT